MNYKIYRLMKDNKTVYVGKTEKLYLCDRVGKHRWQKKDFDSYELIELTEDPTREKYWINHYDTFNNGLNTSEDGIGHSAVYHSGSFRKRPIKVFNDNGFEKEYESLHEASRQLNLDYRNLSAVATGKRKTHKGYKAEYIMEVI